MLPRPEASLLHFKSSGRSASVSDSVGGGTWGQRVRARAAEECAASSESLAWEKSRERMEQGTRRTGVNSSGLAGCGPTPGPTPTRPCPQGDSSRPSPGPLKQSRTSPGPDSLCCAETQPRKSVQRRAREKKVERSPRPQEVSVGGRDGFLPKEKGTNEECTSRPRYPGQGAAGSPGFGRALLLPPIESRGARASRRQAPLISGTHRVRGCPSSSIMVGATE